MKRVSSLKANNMVNLNPVQDIANVIGCVCNDLSLIRDTSINIEVDDFVQNVHKITFASIKNIAIKSPLAESVSARDVDNYLSPLEGKHKKWLEQKGYEYVQQCIEKSNPDTFEISYQRLKKLHLLRSYLEVGIDIKEIYDHTSLDNDELDASMEKIDNMKMEEIIDFFSVKLLKVKDKFNIDTDVKSFKAGENLDELFEDLAKGPDYGIPFDNPYYNALFRGMSEEKLLIQSAGTGDGKAITHGTKIPTPQGWKLVEDIKIGDKLFDRRGKETNVVGVYPQGVQDVYRVTLKDGRYIDCNLEHLWEVYDSENKKRIWDTKKMIDYISNWKKKGYPLSIKNNQPVEYKEKDLPIDPYVLGATLGDGCITKENQRFSISSGNDGVPNEVARRLNSEYVKNKHNYNYHFKLTKDLKTPQRKNKEYLYVSDVFNNLNELIGKYSKDKYIPREYLLGSINQRLKLLQGLMDTDGCIFLRDEERQASISFSSVSKQLAEDVRELGYSLGFKNTIKYLKTKNYYQVVFSIPSRDIPKLFLADDEKIKKAEIAKNHQDRKLHDFIKIKSIEKLNKQEHQVCFTVDNDEHLFLVGDYVVTHNTRNAIKDVCETSVSHKYNFKTKQYEPIGIEMPTLLISTELEQKEVNILMLAYISGVPQKVIQDSNYEPEIARRLTEAKNILEEAEIYCVVIKDFSLQDITDIIERHVIEKDIVMAAFDYIQLRPKLQRSLNELNGGVIQREDQVLATLAESLKYTSEKYKIFIRTSTQLSRNIKDNDKRDQDSLAGGRATANKADFGVITMKTKQKDLKEISHILSNPKWGNKTPNYMHFIYKNRQGQDFVIIWTQINLGNLREEVCFVTDYDYNLLEDIKPEYFTYDKVEDEEDEIIEVEEFETEIYF